MGFSLFALPPTQIWGLHVCAVAAVSLWSTGAGSGGRVLACGQTQACLLARALNGHLVFTKPETQWHIGRGAIVSNKCPFWMSSTQWGRKATLWAEEHMAGLRLAAVATAGVALISPYLLLVGIKRSLANRTSHSKLQPGIGTLLCCASRCFSDLCFTVFL